MSRSANRDRLAGVLWPALVAVATAVGSAIPLLWHRTFYLRGDSGAQFAPTWYHLGRLVRDGHWPPTLDPDVFAGGNYAAEALHGIYNPLNVLVWLTVSGIDDLVLGVWLVKAAMLVLLALGCYALAREYVVPRWAAAVLGVIVPFGGFTLFWDAGSWPTGLLAFGYTVWVWWAFRRVLRGRLNPFWGFVIGALGVTQGNPYGTVGVVVVGAALVVEGFVDGERRGAVRLLLVGGCVATLLPLAYLPLLETSSLGARAFGALVANNGKLRPQLGDLFGLSSPTFVPDIRAISGPMQVPAAYFSWLVLPLLPWLDYRLLRRRGRELTGVGLVGAFYLLMALAPSKLWQFRWPLRVVEYLYLCVGLVVVLLLGAGLRRDGWRLRLLGSGALVVLAGYLSWAEAPQHLRAGVGGPVLLAVLAAALLGWHRLGGRLGDRLGGAGLALIAVAGTLLVVVAQVVTFGENGSSRLWQFPTDVSSLQRSYGAQYDGRIMSFANLKPLQEQHRIDELHHAWRHVLAGSMYQVAGVPAVNSYTGIGYSRFQQRLCMTYDGLTRPCGYRNVWQPAGLTGPPIADLLKLDEVVARPKVARGVQPAAGWQVVQRRPVVVVRRSQPPPWPGSRLSDVPAGVQVSAARSTGLHRDEVRLDGGTGGRLTFAILDWPGYHATLDGRPVPVGHDFVGLLTVRVPAGASGTLVVGYQPPGWTASLAAAGLGLLGALALGLGGLLGRRRRTTQDPAAATGVGEAGVTS